jgi:predicted RNA-binding Zn-ribbon protein involved in translation (DUF1610 family)
MVFSYIDMGVLLSIGVIVALGLLFFGRPHLIRDTVMFPARVVARARTFRPAMLKESFQSTAARVSNMTSRIKRRTTVAQEDSQTLAGIDVIDASMLEQIQGEDTSSPAEIAAFMPADSIGEVSSSMQEEVPAAVVEQDEASVEISEPETPSATAETEELPVNIMQSTPAESETVEAPTNGDSGAAKEETGYVCQVCGSSQLVKKESKRPNQQRYQCQACGASSNFGPKRVRKHRQKNRVESLV